MDQLPRSGNRELICLLFGYLLLCGFCSERFPLPLGAWDSYIILLCHSLSLSYAYFTNSQNTKGTYGQPSEQLFPKRWPFSNGNRTENNMNTHAKTC